MTLKDKIIRNSMFSAAANFSIMIIGFFLLPFMLHRLGNGEYGLFSMVNIFMITGYIAIFELGFKGAIVKYVAEFNKKKEFEKISKLYSSSFVLFLLIGICFAITGYLLSNLLVTNVFKIDQAYWIKMRWAFSIVFLSYIYQFPSIIVMSYLEGFQRFDVTQTCQIITYVLYAIGIVVLLLLEYGFLSIVSLQVSVLFLQFIIQFVASLMINKKVKFGIGHLSIRSLRQVGGMTSLLWIHRVSGTISNSAPKVIVSIFLGPAAVALYEASVRVPKVLKGLLGFINSAIFPAASEIDAVRDDRRLATLFRKTVRYHVVFLIPCLTCAAYLSKEFLGVWLGPDYVKLAPYFLLTLAWAFLTPYLTVGGVILKGMNKDLKKMTLYGVLIAILNIGIPLLLIKKYGLISIFIGLFSSNMILFPYAFKLFTDNLAINLKEFVLENLKIILIGIIPLIFTSILQYVGFVGNYFTLITKGLAWLFIYWIILYKYILDTEDRIVISTVKNKLFNRSKRAKVYEDKIIPKRV